jgi:uncharacterized protein YcbX
VALFASSRELVMLRLSALYRYPLKSGKAEILQTLASTSSGWRGIDAGCS